MSKKCSILLDGYTTANRNDAAVAPALLASLGQWEIEFVLGDAAYDSEKVRQTAKQAGILFISPINRCIAGNEKRPMAGFFLSF
jgi:hypothetical protein